MSDSYRHIFIRICAQSFMVVCLLLLAGFVYAEWQARTGIVVSTANVFPGTVSGTGWGNVEGVLTQNLSGDALYQDFNTINAAYLLEPDDAEKTKRINISNEEPIDVEPTASSTPAVEEEPATTTEEVVEENATSTDETVPAEVSDEPAVSPAPATTTATEITDVATTSTEANNNEQQNEESDGSEVVETNTPDESATTTGSDDTEEDIATTTVLSRVRDSFVFAFTTFTDQLPFANESATSTTGDQSIEESIEEPAESTAEEFAEEESAEGEVVIEETLADEVASSSATTTASEVIDTTPVATSTSGIEIGVSTTTSSDGSDTKEQDVVEEVVGLNEEESTETETAESSQSAQDDAVVPYSLTMSNFWLPVFAEDQTRITDGQVRVSLAGQKESHHRDKETALAIEYSFDNERTWVSGGEVEIIDEVSNSINGDYYLFALPNNIDVETLKDLSVRIVYEGERDHVSDIYIEAAWLQLFTETGEAVNDPLADFDDNFSHEILSGDTLVTPEGSIDFTFTDNNDNESLIIKSDETTYNGLSEATTYFSVTNTSDRTDSFEVKTYFPRNVGTVTSLEVWNQNKPHSVTIPEFRPFVYHCSGGWDIEVPASESAVEFAEETEQATSTATSSEELFGEGETVEIVEPISTSTDVVSATTTVQAQYNLSTPFAQASATSTESLATTTIAQGEVIPQTYYCPELQQVQQCDYLSAEDTECRVEQKKVHEHELTAYRSDWQGVDFSEDVEDREVSRLARLGGLLGVAPAIKDVPDRFEARTVTGERYSIQPGETRYFKMDISFPAFSTGEYWIEAIGSQTYGLLDPFWNSDWTYRIPIEIDNTAGTSDLTEHQVFLQLDSGLSDFWSNVATDGSDIRFVQEVTRGNLFDEIGPEFDNRYSPDWNGRVALTIPASQVSVTLSNFPVYVDLSTLGNNFWTGVTDDGRDIRVTASDGETEVPHELVSIATTTQTGELYFRAPSLSPSSDTTFHIYFDNPSATAYAETDTYGAQNVWTNGYTAVYHFEGEGQTGRNNANEYTDSTSNNHDAEDDTDATSTAGFLGGGVGFDPTNDTTGVDTFDHLDLPTAILEAQSEYTMSTWYRTDNGGGSPEHTFVSGYGGGSGGAENETIMRVENSTLMEQFTNGGGANQGGQVAIADIGDDVWRHFTYTFADDASGDFAGQFLNGAEVFTDTAVNGTELNYDAGALIFGAELDGAADTSTGLGEHLDGQVDEVRFSDIVRSDEWIAAEYTNMFAPTTFYATSTAAPQASSVTGWYNTSWNNRVLFTVPASENLTDFPVYVDLSIFDSEFFADVAADGGDIRVVSEDGMTEYPVEVVTIDTGAETGELYFKTDLSAIEGANYYLYFNNPEAQMYDRTDTYGSDNVWTNGYVAVYHLEEKAAGTGNSNLYKDSTANQYDGDDFITSTGTTGLFGAGQEFGILSQTDYINLPREVLDGRVDITTSWWMQSSAVSDMTIISGANSTFTNEYWTRFDDNFRFFLYAQNGAEQFNLSDSVVNYADGNWQYYMATSDESADEMNLYINGVGDTENPDPQAIATTSIDIGGLVIGQDQDIVGGNFSTAENFEGNLDALRFAEVVRPAEWAAVMYDSMNDNAGWLATSSVEVLSATEFVELDFWLQHYDYTGQESDVWVQVAEVPAGARTTIWLYYGASGATSASNELATFSYTTPRDLYYVVDDSGADEISIMSLIDNNQITVGASSTVLDAGERTVFTTFTGATAISANGPISGTVSETGPGNNDTIVPISFATTTHVGPTNRDTDRWYVYAPFATTTATTAIAAASTGQTQTINTGAVATFTTNPSDSGTANDGDGITIEASTPVLAFHRTTVPGDGYALYPPTLGDLYGFDSNFAYTGAVATTDVDYFCSDGTTNGTESSVTRGEKRVVDSCAAVAQLNGDSIRLTGHTEPITALQQADSDGRETTAFWPELEFGTEYAITNDAQYIAIACSPRFGTTTVELVNPSGSVLTSATCNAGGDYPGTAYFGDSGTNNNVTYTQGHTLRSANNVPFYVVYEDVSQDSEETNVLGPVQARQFDTDFAVEFGNQELANDASYEQRSFGWYQNIDASTPTSTWSLGNSEFVAEGEAIRSSGAVDTGDVLRLRMNIAGSNATGTVGSAAFKLQYGTAFSGQCSLIETWTDVGPIGSTTVSFAGYNNAGVSDGTVLATSTLLDTTVLATYEERNLSNVLQNEIGIGDVAEFDWVMVVGEVEVNTNYCFRMVRASGGDLNSYTTYPELETVGPPSVPQLISYFDNAHIADLDTEFTFVATDITGDEIDYQIQIDTDRSFATPDVDIDSADSFLDFENIADSSDKAPFTSGATVRFTSPTTLSDNTTYWWRVRAADPAGSATSSDWSTPFSFTSSSTLPVSEWYQTTGEQFSTNEITGSLATTSGEVTGTVGALRGTTIDFDDALVGNAWGTVFWDDLEPVGSISIQVEYNDNGTWSLIPDADLPNNSVGATTSPVSILNLDTTTYNEIRLVANYSGTGLELREWGVRWGLRVETPVLGDLFDNQQTADTVPVFDFISNDPQGDDLTYEISFSTDRTFETSSSTFISDTDLGFANSVNGGDTDPFNSGDTITYTAQSAFTNGTTYWWRVRAKDPTGGDAFSPWSEADAFTIDTGTTVSTWYQTTQEQFDQGTLNGTIASTSDSVELTNLIGEYGTRTLTNNNWLTVTTQQSYQNMVVVGSPEFDPATNNEGRTVRVRNKTENTFEIKVDDYTDAFTGSTVVDFIVMEAGTWTMDDGATGLQVIAGTEQDVSDTQSAGYVDGIGSIVTFDSVFSGAPAALATISSNNNSDWIGVHIDAGADRDAEVTASQMGIALAKSKGTSATHAGSEDVDYIVFDTGNGTNRSVNIQTLNTSASVVDDISNSGYNQSLTGFSAAPAVTVVQNNAENGGDGAFAYKDTSGTQSSGNLFLAVIENNNDSDAHGGAEVVSVAAFEASSGLISRLDSGTLSGTIASEPMIFSDGAGPKFANFQWSDSTPGSSDILYQIQYAVGDGTWALIPDGSIPGNSVGTTSSPIDLTNVDINTYDTIRTFATFTCGGGSCPQLDDWTLEWSEGVIMSGDIFASDRTTPVATGTIRAAVNGVLVGDTGSVASGTWSIPNVTAFAGDVIHVWVDGANDSEEAVTVFKYDGVGDITGVTLYEQHLAFDADEPGTISTADIALYDNLTSGDEDIFFDVDGTNNLDVCSVGVCANNNIYVASNQTFEPATSTTVTVTTHDIVNDGTLSLDSNILEVTGSWINTATTSVANASVAFTALVGTETIIDPSDPLAFNTLSFGTSTSVAAWNIDADLDLSGNLSVLGGTFNRGTSSIAVTGDIYTAAGGIWSGVGTTTFDGSGVSGWRDDNASTSLQNIGSVFIDGSAKTILVTNGAAAYDITIGSNDTLNGGTDTLITVGGDWINNGTFISGTSEVVIVSDNRTYPGTIPGTANWYSDTDFTQRMVVSVDSTEVSADLTDFPVYLDLSVLGSGFWSGVKSDGGDIRMTTADGQTEMPIDLVWIDDDVESGELHFLAPSLSSATNTDFYVYFNNPAANGYADFATNGAHDVWQNYDAVYHFEVDDVSISAAVPDMTGNGYDLSITTEGLATTTGQLGTAIDLAGSTGYLTTGWSWASGDRLESSGWYRQSAASNEALWAWGTGTTMNFMPWFSGTQRGYHRFGSSAGAFTFDFTPRDTVNWQHFTTVGPTSTSEQVVTYINTIVRDNPTQVTANPSGGALQIGRYTTAGSYEGQIDELRFAQSTRGSDWVVTEYANQTDPAAFFATSSVETYVPAVTPDAPSHQIDSGGSSFYQLTLDDATTTPFFVDSVVTVSDDFTIATGTITFPSTRLSVGGSFLNSGTFMHNNAELEFTSSAAEIITLNGTAFTNTLDDVTFDGSGSWSFTDANATTSGTVQIADGSVTLPSGTLAIGETLTVTGGSFDDNNGQVVFTGIGEYSVTTGGSSFNTVQFGNLATLPWYGTAWQERVPVAIPAGTVSNDLTNFPVFIDLSSFGSTFWSGVATDGADIRVTTGNGFTEVPSELVEIDTAGQTGELHFLAPTIADTATTTFYVYFNNPVAVAPATDSTYGAEAVWSEYEAVYHFTGDPASSFPDSTRHDRELALAVGTGATSTGVYGTALDISADGIMYSNAGWTWPAGEDLVSSGWYYMDSIDNGGLWQWGSSCPTDNCLAYLPWYDSTDRGYHRVGETGGNDFRFSRVPSVWNHFMGNGRVTSGESVDIFVNTILRDSYTQTGSGEDPTQTGLQVGRYQTGNYLAAQIDELRFATTTRATDWINAEYTNGSDPTSFYATSTTESLTDAVPRFVLNEVNTDVDSNLIVQSAELVAPSDTLTIGGSLTTISGTYNNNTATTTFDSAAGAETISIEDNSFYNLIFDAAGGDWTPSGNVDVTNDARLLNGTQFTLAPGAVMTVGGVFQNSMAAATTWTDSTLILTGGDYVITDRLDAGDTYGTIQVSNDTDITIWNSTIATSTILDTSSLYLPDFGGTDGLLRIFGSYERLAGTEYWSYATDFDGTDLTGGSNERPVTVQLGNGTELLFATSTTLEVVGDASASTSVSVLFGLYQMELRNATLRSQYAEFTGMGNEGIELRQNTTVDTLTDTLVFVPAGRSGITVDATTVNAQPSSVFNAVSFASTTATNIYDPAWSDQLSIMILASSTNATLTDYPVYVNLNNLGDAFWTAVATDGADIRVTTDSARELPIDVVSIDTSARTGELHFLAPEISAENDTSFFIHYNNPSASMYAADDRYGTHAVWEQYEAVYHFEEDPTISVTDHTGNEHTLFPIVGTPATTTGQLGTAVDTTTSSVMLQAPGWTWPAGDDLISSGLYFMDDTDTGALWQFGTGNGTNNGTYLAFMPNYDQTNRGRHFFGITSGAEYTVSPYNNAIWHHFTTIGRAAAGEVNQIYEDGVLWDSVTQISSSQNPSNTGLKIGRYQGGTYGEIQVDELRFATTTQGVDWINAELLNFINPTAFYSTSTISTAPGANVTTDGVPGTFWLFSNGSGDRYGEAFDNDDGDPGSIQWDDSNFSITVSGVVYADDGVTPQGAPVCNNSTEVVVVTVNDTDTYQTSCDATTGEFSVSGITYVGEPVITAHLSSGATTPQTNVALFDEITGNGTVSGGNLTVSRPEVVDDSVLVLLVGRDDNPTVNTAAGWTAISTLGNTTGDDLFTGAWYRVVSDASSEAATYDFTTTENGEGFSYWMGSFVNADTASPIATSTSWNKIFNSFNPTATSTNTLVNGAFALSASYTFNDTDTSLPGQPWQARADDITDGVNSLNVVSYSQETAGPVGDAAFGNVVIGRESHVLQLAIAPALAPTATGTAVAATVTKTPLGSHPTGYADIEFVDQRVSVGTVAAGATFSIDRPYVENGDLLIAITAREDDFTIDAPAGWTLEDALAGTVGSQMYTAVWSRVVSNAATEPTSYSFTSNDSNTEEYSAWVGSYRNVDTGTIFDVPPSWNNIQNTNTPTASSVTPVSNGTHVVAAWYVVADNTLTLPGGVWQPVVDNLHQGSRNLMIASQQQAVAVPSTDATVTSASTDDVNVVQFALRPESRSVSDSLDDFDLYQNRLIVRHEDITPISIADLAVFDSTDTPDLPFTAATTTTLDSLTVAAGSGLVVWSNDTFTANGDVTLAGVGTTTADGSLLLKDNAALTQVGTEQLTIGGSLFLETAATLNTATSAVTFTATQPGQSIGAAGSSTINFTNVSFTGVGGGWNVATPITVFGDINVATGTFTGNSDITVQTGSFSGNGSVALIDGVVEIGQTNTLGGTQPWQFYDLQLGDGVTGSQVTTPASNATTTILNDLTIAAGHVLDAGSSQWLLTGTGVVFTENGTLSEDTSRFTYGGNAQITRTPYHNLSIEAATGTTVVTGPVTGLQVLGSLNVGRYSSSTLDLNTNDPLTAVGGSVFIGPTGVIEASDTADFEFYGNYDNNGIFTANGGTAAFLRATGTASIAPGISPFANVDISGSADFTITEHATATNNFTLAEPASLTLASGNSLGVGGTFTNTTAQINTWTASTLRLYGNNAYEVNTKDTSDTYATVVIANGTQPRFWNSSFATTTISATSSLYSMDHNNVNGDLYIFGAYTNATFTDSWSYAEDWDGAVLGVPRQADVYIEDSATVLYTGGSLLVRGSSTASTTIQNQGTGTYDLTVGGSATTDWEYVVPRDLGLSGLQFTGTPTVEDILAVDWEVSANNGSAMTVAGTVINANPAKNFDRNRFNETGVTSPINVTTTGSSVSSWRFTNHSGNLDGESFDADSGDPGEIVWSDSAALITISGTVYEDNESTAYTLCDSVAQTVRLVVAGLTATTTSCAAGTGAYSFSNVGFGPSDSIIVYIDDGSNQGAAVTADPISNITNMDIYVNHLIVRHESTDPIRINDLEAWNGIDDADVPFAATVGSPDTLTLDTDIELVVWNNKTFAPDGNVTSVVGTESYAGDWTLRSGATFTASGTEAHIVGGSLAVPADGTFTAASSTFIFSSDQVGNTIATQGVPFYTMAFTGTGDWTVSDTDLTAGNDLTISGGGDLTLPSATTTIGGDLNVTSGSFDNNSGIVRFTSSDAGNIVVANNSPFNEFIVDGTGDFSLNDTNLTVNDSFQVATGTVTMPTGTTTIGDNFTVRGTLNSNNGVVDMTGATSHTVRLSGNNLGSLVISGGGTTTMSDATAALTGDLTISSGTLVSATNTLAIGGSLDAASGTLLVATSTIFFDSTDTGETVAVGFNTLHNVVVNSATGGWTFESATTTGNFSLLSASVFTLGSTETLRVEGVFTNTVGGAATTWTGSTLVLASDDTYTVNTKAAGGDSYDSLVLVGDTDVRFWNSSYPTLTLSASSSVYSQDHTATNGLLTIFGDVATDGSDEHWSYATDFDGVALGGSPRPVSVIFATTTPSSYTLTSGSLTIAGDVGATTTIASEGGGFYGMTIEGGTLAATNYQFDDLDTSGLTFVGTPTITGLNNGLFNQATNSAVMITLPRTTLDANAGLLITDTGFTDSGFTGGVNVSLSATSTNSWRFQDHYGDLGGEDYDIDGTDACSSIRWDDSACLLTEQTEYRWRNDDGGEGALDSEWYDTDWDFRQRVRLANSDGATYTNVPVLLTVPYDTDMQSDFTDIRFTSNDGITEIPYWIERFSSGISADIWVQVPSLVGASTTEMFMYYDNLAASTLSSSTAVFTAVDDFEEGTLGAYSGETGFFNVGSSIVWGGSNSLDTSGNESARADYGIFRFDQTVSQGEIIRYRQFVDASGNNESCTLFGVQSPGTTSENYAVCVELQGTDRLSLVRDAESTDLVGGVVVLDQTNVTYSTDWYEIEIDWQTDDDIFVSLFDASDTLVATTSANDSTYTSGGYGFTFWGFDGAWDSYVSYPRLDSKPQIFFGAEQGRGGATWRSEQGAVGSGYGIGDVARLRIAIENTGLDIENQNFRLEYAAKGVAGTCQAVSGASYNTVSVAGSCGLDPLCMINSANLTDGESTTDHLAIAEGTFVAGEVVENASNQTSALDVNQSRYTEIEYALTLTSNAADDAYCFRVTNAGTELDSYADIPELSLEFTPSIGIVTFNDGTDIALSLGTTTAIIASTTVSDLNGFADIAFATTTFYRTGVTPSCTPDDNNCYVTTTNDSCTLQGCSGASCNLVCVADFAYHTDPTDVGSPQAGEEWFAYVEVEDAAGNSDLNTSVGIVDVLTIRGLDVTDGIGYGALDINQSTSPGANPASTITNLGNESIDVSIDGTDMTDGGVSVIDVTQQKFATSTFNYAACTACVTLDVVANTIEVDLFKPTVSSPPVTDLIYWGIEIPFGTNSAPHSGLNSFEAAAD